MNPLAPRVSLHRLLICRSGPESSDKRQQYCFCWLMLSFLTYTGEEMCTTKPTVVNSYGAIVAVAPFWQRYFATHFLVVPFVILLTDKVN